MVWDPKTQKIYDAAITVIRMRDAAAAAEKHLNELLKVDPSAPPVVPPMAPRVLRERLLKLMASAATEWTIPRLTEALALSRMEVRNLRILLRRLDAQGLVVRVRRGVYVRKPPLLGRPDLGDKNNE